MVTCTRSKKAPHKFYISSMNKTHADCCIAPARPSQRQIQNLREFQVAVASDQAVSARTLIETVQATSHIPLHQQKSKVYRAKEAVLSLQAGHYDESFGRLPSLLRELKDVNPGSTILLDNDQEKRFFRLFVCLAGTVRCLSFCQEVYGFDGAHFKRSKYTGLALTLLTRDGNNRNFPVAFAIVSSENEVNVRWFIDCCLEAGVPLTAPIISSALPPLLFCDRGVLLTVAANLDQEEGLVLNLKFCSIHIIRNIKSKFMIFSPRLEHHVWDIQGAKTAKEYETALENLKKEYGDAVEKYVRDIPPERWTVHGSKSKLT